MLNKRLVRELGLGIWRWVGYGNIRDFCYFLK